MNNESNPWGESDDGGIGGLYGDYNKVNNTNDMLADRDDGGFAGLFNTTRSGENDKARKVNQQMGDTAVKAAELQQVKEQIRAAKDATEQRVAEAESLKEQVAARAEQASEFAGAAVSMQEKIRQIKADLDQKFEEARASSDRLIEEIANAPEASNAESANSETARLEKENQAMQAQIEAQNDKIAKLEAEIEAMKYLFQQAQEQSDEKLTAFAEANAATAEATPSATPETIPDDIADEMLKDAGMQNGNTGLDFADEDNTGLDFADEDAAERGNMSFEDDDMAERGGMSFEDDDGVGDIIIDLDDLEYSVENALDQIAAEKELAAIEKAEKAIEAKEAGDEKEGDNKQDNKTEDAGESKKKSRAEKRAERKEKARARRNRIKERLGEIRRKINVRALIGVLAVSAFAGAMFGFAMKQQKDAKEAVKTELAGGGLGDEMRDIRKNFANKTQMDLMDNAGENQEAALSPIETNFYIHNDEGAREDIQEDWAQRVSEGENLFDTETRESNEAVSADKKESKYAFGTPISDKELSGDMTGFEREYGIKSAERMAKQSEYMLLRGTFLGAWDGLETGAGVVREEAEGASETEPGTLDANWSLLSKDGNVSLENLNRDARLISGLSADQKQILLDAAISKSANLFQGTAAESYTVKAGTRYLTMHFESVEGEDGETHLEIKRGSSVKNEDFEVMQYINEDGNNVWDTNDVKINVLKAMNLIDSNLTLEEAAKSGVMDRYTVLGERNKCGGQIVVIEKGTRKVNKITEDKVVEQTPVQQVIIPQEQTPTGSVPSNPTPDNPTPDNPNPPEPTPPTPPEPTPPTPPEPVPPTPPVPPVPPTPPEPGIEGKTDYDVLDGAGTVMGETVQEGAGERTDVFGDGTYNVVDDQGQINDADISTMDNIAVKDENGNNRTDENGRTYIQDNENSPSGEKTAEQVEEAIERGVQTTATNENERYQAAQEAGGSENAANEAVGAEIPAETVEDQSDERTEEENRDVTQADQAAAIAEYLNNQ